MTSPPDNFTSRSNGSFDGRESECERPRIEVKSERRKYCAA